MPPKRSSKCLLGEEPSAEKVTKRARKPNANTLDAFSAKQAPIRRKTTGKRKDTKVSGPSQDILLPEKTPVSLIPIPSTPGIPLPAPSSLIYLTLIPLYKRANAPSPLSPFNPNNEGKIPYNMSLIIILIINRSCKSNTGIYIYLNINNIFYNNLKALYIYIYKRYIK
jgi:hypothetical protein